MPETSKSRSDYALDAVFPVSTLTGAQLMVRVEYKYRAFKPSNIVLLEKEIISTTAAVLTRYIQSYKPPIHGEREGFLEVGLPGAAIVNNLKKKIKGLVVTYLNACIPVAWHRVTLTKRTPDGTATKTGLKIAYQSDTDFNPSSKVQPYIDNVVKHFNRIAQKFDQEHIDIPPLSQRLVLRSYDDVLVLAYSFSASNEMPTTVPTLSPHTLDDWAADAVHEELSDPGKLEALDEPEELEALDDSDLIDDPGLIDDSSSSHSREVGIIRDRRLFAFSPPDPQEEHVHDPIDDPIDDLQGEDVYDPQEEDAYDPQEEDIQEELEEACVLELPPDTAQSEPIDSPYTLDPAQPEPTASPHTPDITSEQSRAMITYVRSMQAPAEDTDTNACAYAEVYRYFWCLQTIALLLFGFTGFTLAAAMGYQNISSAERYDYFYAAYARQRGLTHSASPRRRTFNNNRNQTGCILLGITGFVTLITVICIKSVLALLVMCGLVSPSAFSFILPVLVGPWFALYI